MRHPLRYLAALFFAVSLLSACATQPTAEANYPSGVYAVAGQYIWDSWIVADEGRLHRYALSAPTEGYGPNDRHQHAFVRHAISEDGGRSWEDLGPAIEPQPKGTWPDHVIWTSSVMLRKDAMGEKEFILIRRQYRQYSACLCAFTARRSHAAVALLQQVAATPR